MEKRVVNNIERGLTTTVNDIEHTESLSLNGMSVIKLYLQPGASVDAATAKLTAIAQTSIRQMPPGTTPPLILRYSATNVPILQLALESDSLPEQQLFDYATNFVRNDIATVRGAQLPWPYGGKPRQVMVDIDPPKLYGWGLSPQDVSSAIAAQNVVLPSGTAKVGDTEYPVLVNATAQALGELGAIPIRTVRGTPVYVRDVAHVRDGYAPQTSLVHVQWHKSVLMSVLKQGTASTLDVVSSIRTMLPQTLARLPKELRIATLFDQSVFVRAAVQGVVREGAIAAGLTAVMLLLFLGSWRSTVIVLGVDPAFDPRLDHRPLLHGPDAQRHDPRRHGARRRHPRGRRHRRDREHPPAPGHGQADRAVDPRRRGGDRGAGVRVDALHLHRIRPGRVHHRSGKVAVRAARARGRHRDVYVVLPVANARADDDALPRPALARPPRADLRPAAARLRGLPRLGARAPRADHHGLSRLRRRLSRSTPSSAPTSSPRWTRAW